MVTIIDGKKIANSIIKRLKIRITKLHVHGITPRLAVMLIGNDPASLNYISRKRIAAEQAGIHFLFFHYHAQISPSAIIKHIKAIQHRTYLGGIIIQLPLPRILKAHQQDIINAIDPRFDVDCLTDTALGALLLGTYHLPPPTPSAILVALAQMRIPLKGKHIAIIGRGNLIGKPLVNLLLRAPVTLTICGRATHPLAQFTRQADIIISGVGKKKLITGAMVKQGAVIIDAGFSLNRGVVSGDVDMASVLPKASFITPVPGGIGPITVAMLLENVVTNTERIYLNREMRAQKI